MHHPPPHTAEFFDAIFRADDDPWHFKSQWYEARKRALTLASLPRSRYASGFEPGCANGVLSAELAPRCERYLCTDGSALAVDSARRRLAGLPHVQVRQMWLPDEWLPEEWSTDGRLPDGWSSDGRLSDEPAQPPFDLIVISELGYYLPAAQLAMFIDKVRRSSNHHATVLACHWRHPIEGCELRGDDVHAMLAKHLALPHFSSHVERDFRLDVWSHGA